MPKEQSPGKPTTPLQPRGEGRRGADGPDAEDRVGRPSRATVARVARQLGYGVESVRSWVRQADIDEGLAPGFRQSSPARSASLSRRSENSSAPTRFSKRAASFFGAELDRQHKK